MRSTWILYSLTGFHKRWQKWGEEHPEGSVQAGLLHRFHHVFKGLLKHAFLIEFEWRQVDGKLITREFGPGNPFPVPLDDPLQQETVRIGAPKGSLVLWDSRGSDEELFRGF